MTTAPAPSRPTRGTRSPLAPHGTTARAIGRPGQGIPGCPCPPCRAAKSKDNKRRALLNATGRAARIPAGAVADHVRQLLAAGMGWPGIAKAAGSSTCTLHRLLAGQELIRRSVAMRILAVHPQPAGGRYLSLIGTRRRIHALIAIGYTVKAIADTADVDPSVLNDILHGHIPNIRGVTADRIAAAYRQLSTHPPTGLRKSAVTRSRRRAAAEGWPPPAAWDDNAIDDPDAHPDWTGRCGTDRGWHMHQLQRLPMCHSCQNAHQQWLAEHAHLDGLTRGQALLAARQQASTRGQDIADDARELFRQGHTRQQAADRLGVTPEHLGQTLFRHPEPVFDEEDAA